MIKVDPVVYVGIRTAFPKKADSTIRVFNQYIERLDAAIFASLNKSKSVYNLYDVSLKKLQGDTKVTINGKKEYLHKWLQDNYKLFDVIHRGNNIDKTISQIKLTSLVTYEDPTMTMYADNLDYTQLSDCDIDELIDKDSNTEIFNVLYPEFKNGFTLNHQAFDYSPINIESLKGFIEWFSVKSSFTPNKTRRILRQARIILAVAMETNGWLPQFKNKSAFGRTYYRGISMQSVYKELRYAALGDCYQYDIRASAIAWKLKYANEIDPNRNWNSSKLYVTDKHEIINDIYETVFKGTQLLNSKTDEYFEFTREQSSRMIKRAFTSISFGARATAKGCYYDSTGNVHYNALSEIIESPVLLQKFLDNFHVKRFISDGQLIEDVLFNKVKDLDEVKNNPELRTKTRLSKSKVIAYMYQQEETELMNDVRFLIEKMTNSKVIANIHDAVILDKPLSVDNLYEIEYAIRAEYNNPLWKLVLDKHSAYSYIPKSVRDEEEAFRNEHRNHIRREQRAAEEWARGGNNPYASPVQVNVTPVVDEEELWRNYAQEMLY